jgi:hypothetical protein
MAGPSRVGYIEDVVWPYMNYDFKDFEYYWFTPYHYIRWRSGLHGKTQFEAREEIVWLIQVRKLIACTDEGGARMYFIDVRNLENVFFLRRLAD